MVTEFSSCLILCSFFFSLFVFFYCGQKQGSGVPSAHVLRPLLLPPMETLMFLSVGVCTLKFIIFILEDS